MITTDIESRQVLQQALLQREKAFADAPLLKRIDPLGLMDAVGGFPVRGWIKSGDTIVEQALLSGPVTGKSSLQLPPECSGMSGQKE